MDSPDSGPAADPGSTVDSSTTPVTRRLLTPGWIAFTAFVLVAVAAFLFLAWWQLGRFESASGTWQNLGYGLQWPFFAVFAVYVWWKLLRDATRSSGGPAPARRDPRAAHDHDREAEEAMSLTEIMATIPSLPPKQPVPLPRADSSGADEARPGQPPADRSAGDRTTGDQPRPGRPRAGEGDARGSQVRGGRTGAGADAGRSRTSPDDDAEHAAYNAYLSALHRRTQEGTR